MTALHTFAAAARHLSFKRAAEALNLTPTAVSHQVRALEDRLGHRLFDRRVRQVSLTLEGEELARAVLPAFETIDHAVARLVTRPDRKTVTLGAGPIFASHWLAPRLGEFWRANPKIDLRLHHSPLPVHQQMERYDLAIAWGVGDWPGLEADPLMRVTVSPVVSPAWSDAMQSPIRPEDLPNLPLLHQADHAGWRQWLEAAGVAVDGDLSGTIFEDANVLLQAALEGQGIALGVLPLVADEISTGRLVRPWGLEVEPAQAYFLIHRPGVLERDSVARVRDWLVTTAGQAG